VDYCLAVGPVEAVSERLAVESDDRARGGRPRRLHPGQEAAGERFRIEAMKDAVEGIVRGNAVGGVEPSKRTFIEMRRPPPACAEVGET
jgi:hypothetical protein